MKQYLERYAEPDADAAAALALGSGRRWQSAVVVPAYGEDEILEGLFRSLEAAARRRGEPVLGILVVNAPEEAAAEKRAANERRLRSFDALGTDRFRAGAEIDWLVLDRTSAGRAFGAKDGVGRARKLGADIATTLFASGALRSRYFHTTDADARVGVEYFAEPPGASEREVARLHGYRHRIDSPEDLPLALYEIHLRYYVLGLAAAGSPYAFPTIGSTLSVRYDQYAAVRGFPRRDAAEDFYLLDKLAKQGAIGVAPGTVELLPRASDRVPFGTGRGMARIAETLARGEPYTLFHPAAFARLGVWLASLDALAEHRDPTRLPSVSPRLGAERAVAAALATRKTPATLRRHLHTWFDGLRTLQFLRDGAPEEDGEQGEAPLPWAEALGTAPFLPAPFPSTPREALERLRGLPAATNFAPLNSR